MSTLLTTAVRRPDPAAPPRRQLRCAAYRLRRVIIRFAYRNHHLEGPHVMPETTTAPALDKEQLRDLVAEVLDLDVAEVTDTAHFVDDLDVDSLMALEITVRLEKEYGVKLQETELTAITSLQGTYELLDGKLREQR
ncbi:acyl carrier protein [Streptomyces sp. NPDC052052]|uniref:acyl carrier protein n=1 Tax=Streptomyces sp. NPDC052052 TaxID=3154756 RepID=UPI0034417F2B